MSRPVYSPPFQLLELNVISGQDLAQVSRKMRTYAVAWVHPDRKLSTRVDAQGHNNPTWNDKFVFRVDDEFLYGETSAIMIEIYALHWFRDVHVGTVRVIVGNLIPPAQLYRQHQQHHVQLGMRFVALQVRRHSGRPQGILNIGVALLDTSMRSMPLYSQISASAVGYRHLMGEKGTHTHTHHKSKADDDRSSDNQNQFLLPWIPKPELRRTKSESSSMFGSDMIGKNIKKKTQEKAGSMVSGLEIIKKDNKNYHHNIKKQSSKASSMITGSEIFKKHRNSPHNEPALGALTKSKYGSDISGEAPPCKGPKNGKDRNDVNSLSKSQFGTPKKMNGRTAPLHITESELGPSASEVAAIMVNNKNQYKVEEAESEIMGSWSLESSMEGLQSKLERWRAELPPVYDRSELSSYPISSVAAGGNRHNRRCSDGDGAFSCFGTFCGMECSIVCGGGSSNRKRTGRIKRSPSAGSFSFL
ncbi:uncharacterized protein LOC8265724 [Ricinus communis]|uniref:uncharacterized protein LOC8265724 n=1 Tax=Ricinus communis TaxID=3988 RepID=UPI00201AF6A7|nr:uncharacterized protein LOC8265724 [Ricinus communis]